MERLEHATQWEVLRWRFEAWRTGATFQEVALRRSLVYRVEHLFLLHRETNHWLLHVADDSATAQDSAGVAVILSEIQNLTRDYFFVSEQSGVEEFFVDETRVWIAPGPHAFLAAVIRGHPPHELRNAIETALARIHFEQGAALAHFAGDTSPFELAAPELTACLRSKHRLSPEKPRLTNAWRWIAAVAALLLLCSWVVQRRQQHWRDFIARLKAEPGILVAASERPWFGPSRVFGLRDPLASDPAAIAREANVNPAGVHFEWREYVAADPAITQRRLAPRAAPAKTVTASPALPRALELFNAAFAPPASVKASVAKSTLVLAGAAPYEWIARVHGEAMKIPGISAINGDDLVVEFDPELVLARFQGQFGIPDGVKASIQNGQLIVSGAAPHAWLDRARRGAAKIPGVRVFDDRSVEDIDQRMFQEAKSEIEGAIVSFVFNKDSVTPAAAATLTRMAGVVQRCFDAAAQLGVHINLELRGYGDAVGTEPQNAELSQRRAEIVRDSLVASGLDQRGIKSLGMGTPPSDAGEKRRPGEFDRRVVLRIVIQP